MHPRTASDTSVLSNGEDDRLLAEQSDIAAVDINRRDSPALSGGVRALSTTRLNGASLEILDYLAFGTGVVDAAANLLQSNSYLREVIDADDGLRIANGRLCAHRPRETQEIRERVARASGSAHSAPASAMAATRNSGLAPLLLVFAPVKRPTPKKNVGHPSLVFVIDPDRSVTLDAGLVGSLFGLTSTESRIAVRLAQGMRLDDVSASLGVATSTARSHLKHIFCKTLTGRQADLTMLLRSLLGSLRV